MAAKDPLICVMHMRDSCRRIAEYVALGGPTWPETPLVMDAVCRNITIIGEAANRADRSFRDEHPEIEWSALIGARNVVMHAYEHIRAELIREMAERDVPELLRQCLSLLNDR